VAYFSQLFFFTSTSSQLYLSFSASQLSHSFTGFIVSHLNPKSSSQCFTCTFTYSTSLLTGIFTATGAENFIVHSTFPVLTSVHVSSVFSKYTSNHHSYSTVLSDVTLISDSCTFVVSSSFLTSFDSTSFDTNVSVVDQLSASSVVSSHTVTVVVLVYRTFSAVVSSAFSSNDFQCA
jgi:hypothetical protein